MLKKIKESARYPPTSSIPPSDRAIAEIAALSSANAVAGTHNAGNCHDEKRENHMRQFHASPDQGFAGAGLRRG
ncbi:MAG TPA: hypothetical protein VMV48_14750 [Gallionellaceae bacterium]|nr:hypothetical protein [Gallionellaceae bacterium]